MIISYQGITSNLRNILIVGLLLLCVLLGVDSCQNKQEATSANNMLQAYQSELKISQTKEGHYESQIQAFEGTVKDMAKLDAKKDQAIGRLQDALAKHKKADAGVVFIGHTEGKAAGKTDTIYIQPDQALPTYSGIIDQAPIKATFTARPDSLILDPMEISVPYEVVIEYQKKVPVAIVTPLLPNTKAVEVRAFVKGKPKKSLLPEIASAVGGFILAFILVK